MKLIISGSRSITDVTAVFKVLDAMTVKPDEVVSGCCHGPDSYGEMWAKRNKIPVKKFPADWTQYGRGAGIVRNVEMSNYGDELLCFFDGVSRGSSHMIKRMQHLKKPTTIINL